MPLSFPLQRSVFQLTLPIAEAPPFKLDRRSETNVLASGEIFEVQRGDAAWIANFSLAAMPNARAAAVVGMLQAIGRTGRVMLFEPSRPFPVEDPTGSIVGTRDLAIAGISADRRAVRISGLPSSYVITAGDMISVGYGGGRRYLGRAAETVTASGSGLTPLFEIAPAVPSRIDVAAPVLLRQPYGLFLISSFDVGVADMLNTRGVSFAAVSVPR